MNDVSRRDEATTEAQREDVCVGAHSGGPRANEDASAHEEWRNLAKLIEVETDSAKLMDLAQQLLEELNRNQPAESRTGAASPTSVTGRPAEAQQKDGSLHGENGTTRRTR